MKRMGLLLLAVLAGSSWAFPSTAQVQSTSISAPPVRGITLGNSVVDLNGTWKFQPGDSPWVDGAPVWAQPGFDDSRWAAMDLAPESRSVDTLDIWHNYGTNGFLPGWTKRGFPNLTGYAWYRLRVRVNDPSRSFWIKMPADFDDAYQVFANGRYVGQYGRFSSNQVTVYQSSPISLALPSPAANGDIELAVRFYMAAGTPSGTIDAGGMHQPPQLGLASTVKLLQAATEDSNLHGHFGDLFNCFLAFLFAVLGLWAWLQNRRERVWLWLFLVMAYECTVGCIAMVWDVTQMVSLGTSDLWLQVIAYNLELPLWLMFWWHWFGVKKLRWILALAWLVPLIQMLVTFGVVFGFGALRFPVKVGMPATVLCQAVSCGLLLVPLVVGFRRDRTEAVVAMAPILLLECDQFSGFIMNAFHIPLAIFPFGRGLEIGIDTMSGMLMILVIGVLALRRFVRVQVRQRLEQQTVEQDLEQARELQQRVLIPESVMSPIFRVESEYRPAQTVGGDFFQTLTRPDGTLFVVVGDVSGKGVSAAMLVAVLVGAIRNQVETNFDPAVLMAALNRRLMGRSGGHFATCLAAEIGPDGTMRVANAGHLPPYLNGKEMAVEGSLPLGIVGEAEWRTQAFALQPGDHLTFMTDGVVEATNSVKELFGFERTREISGERAAVIAERAQAFGQEDDITVLSVRFVGAAAELAV